MTKRFLATVLLLAALVLVAVVPLSAAPAQPPQVKPATAAARITTINSAAIATSTNFSGYDWSVYTWMDLFYRVTEPTVNTLTLTIQVSPGDGNWYAHAVSPTLVSGVVTTTNSYVGSIPVSGAQYRVVATLENTETLTPVLKSVLRY